MGSPKTTPNSACLLIITYVDNSLAKDEYALPSIFLPIFLTKVSNLLSCYLIIRNKHLTLLHLAPFGILYPWASVMAIVECSLFANDDICFWKNIKISVVIEYLFHSTVTGVEWNTHSFLLWNYHVALCMA